MPDTKDWLAFVAEVEANAPGYRVLSPGVVRQIEEAVSLSRERLRTNAITWHRRFRHPGPFDSCAASSCKDDHAHLIALSAALALLRGETP